MKIVLRHESGLVKEVKKGFSWTFLFFGLFVPLVRGDLKWTIIMLLLQALAGAFTFGIGAFVVSLIFAFIYNKVYIKSLLEKGYKATTPEDEEIIMNYVNG